MTMGKNMDMDMDMYFKRKTSPLQLFGHIQTRSTFVLLRAVSVCFTVANFFFQIFVSIFLYIFFFFASLVVILFSPIFLQSRFPTFLFISLTRCVALFTFFLFSDWISKTFHIFLFTLVLFLSFLFFCCIILIQNCYFLSYTTHTLQA